MKKALVGVAVVLWSAGARAQGGAPSGSPTTVGPMPAAPPVPAMAPAQPASPPAPPSYYSPPAYSAPAPSSSPGYPAPVYYYPPSYPPPVYAPLPPPPPPMPTVSLTLSPIHLLFPVLELTGELRLGQEAGVALIAGAGRITDKASDGTKVTFQVYEVGTQLRYYVTGDFRRGMQVGAEILYLYVNGSLDDVTGVGNGLALGPFFGWKTTSYAGFTFDVQGGVQIVTAGTKVTDRSGDSTSSNVDYIPMLNLNIGWSF